MDDMNEETLRHVGAIARLRIDDDEVQKFISHFDDIFGFFSRINALEAPGDVAEQDGDTVLRDDTVAAFDNTDDIVAGFPKKRDRINAVPRNL